MSFKNSSTLLSIQTDNETLIQAIREGDEVAKSLFVSKNSGLVGCCVKRFAKHYNLYEDLMQIGYVGLMKALNHFDLSLNVKFSTYAVPIILGEIKRYFRDEGSVRVSRSLKEGFINMLKCKEKLTQKLNREPTYQEIADALQLEVSDVLLAFEANQQVSSLDEPKLEGDGKTVYMMDYVKAKDEDLLLKCALQKELKSLKPRDQLLLHYRYHMGMKQDEIAKKLNLSQVQVSRLEKKLLLELKSRFVKD